MYKNTTQTKLSLSYSEVYIRIPFQERKARADPTPIRLFTDAFESAGSIGTSKWRVNRNIITERAAQAVASYKDEKVHLKHSFDLNKNHKKSPNHDFKHTKDETSIPCLSVIPEMQATSESATPLLKNMLRHSVSLIPVLKHDPDESPASSPITSDLEESEQFSIISSKKNHQRQASRGQPIKFRSLDETVLDNVSISGDIIPATAVTFDVFLSPQTNQVRSSDFFPRRKFSKFNPVQQVSFNEFQIKSTVRKFLANRISELYNSSLNLLVFEQGPPKILVVEDSEIACKTICEQVRYVVKGDPDIAQNGEEAVEQYVSYSEHGFMYYLIFMDIVMPKLDGYQATRKIRELEKEHTYARTYIVGLSADENAENKCKDAGMDQFCNIYIVKKPTTFRDMERIIHSRSN